MSNLVGNPENPFSQDRYVFFFLLGADIKNVCNEAAINAARRKAKFVTYRDLELAVERVVAGEKILVFKNK